MSNSRRQESMNGRNIDGEDNFLRSNGVDDFRRSNGEEIAISVEATTTVDFFTGNQTVNGESSRSVSLVDRLGEILLDRESHFLQCLRALDLHHMGACRVDERLKPMLKANASTGLAEDRFLTHLSQHFETSEVGLLARCLCVPLVSMRVGKVAKQGSMLCPTSDILRFYVGSTCSKYIHVRIKIQVECVLDFYLPFQELLASSDSDFDSGMIVDRNFIRGCLNFTLLLSSDLRISFVGDNGQTERLATLSDASECSAVIVEEINADQSGRSFFMKLLGGETFYFWCSEKSKLLGIDLLVKVKNLLKSKPTLTQLTGISESRLESFATHLRSYLLGPNLKNFQASSSTMAAPWADARADGIGKNAQYSTFAKPLRIRQYSAQTLKGRTPYQGSLSPRSSSFKEGQARIFTSLRSTSREKVRRHGDLQLPVCTPFIVEGVSYPSDKVKPSEPFTHNPVSSLSFLDSLGSCSFPESASVTAQIPPVDSLFSPYYCWCPPCTSPSEASLAKFPTAFSEPFSLPPLSSLLPATGSHGMLPKMPPCNLASVPSLEFPTYLSDPLTRFSFSKQSTQFPTFTPLMCDSIVHIPVVDVCSSGPGYLVSAGPGIATSIPPLYPKLVGPMISESESMVDKGARETLRLLIGGSSSQSSASLMGVFPAVLSDKNNQGGAVVAGSRGLYSGISDVNGIVVGGSRGLYSGISNVNAIVNSFTAVGLTSVSERSSSYSRGVGMNNFSHTSASDALEHTYNSRDLQDSAFMSREQEKD